MTQPSADRFDQSDSSLDQGVPYNLLAWTDQVRSKRSRLVSRFKIGPNRAGPYICEPILFIAYLTAALPSDIFIHLKLLLLTLMPPSDE